MIVRDLEGEEQEWKPKGNLSASRPCSGLHNKARRLIKKLYPVEFVFEETPIEVYGGKRLYLDFYLTSTRMAVEVQGRQHFDFIPHFHKSKFKFLKSQKNDQYKQEWCDINNITLICLRYDEDIKLWQKLLAQ